MKGLFPKAVLRTGLRLVYRLLTLYWTAFGGSARGAAVVIRHEGPEGPEIVLVKPSYRPGPELPGGGCKRDEAPRMAAVRELHEEVGLSIQPHELKVLQEHHFTFSNRQIEETIFLVDVEQPPPLLPDEIEIIEASFHRLDAIDPAAANISLQRALVNLQ